MRFKSAANGGSWCVDDADDTPIWQISFTGSPLCCRLIKFTFILNMHALSNFLHNAFVIYNHHSININNETQIQFCTPTFQPRRHTNQNYAPIIVNKFVCALRFCYTYLSCAVGGLRVNCNANVETRHKGISKFTTYRAPYRQPPTVRRRRRRGWAGVRRRAGRAGRARPPPQLRDAATPDGLSSKTLSLGKPSAPASTSCSTISG